MERVKFVLSLYKGEGVDGNRTVTLKREVDMPGQLISGAAVHLRLGDGKVSFVLGDRPKCQIWKDEDDRGFGLTIWAQASPTEFPMFCQYLVNGKGEESGWQLHHPHSAQSIKEAILDLLKE